MQLAGDALALVFLRHEDLLRHLLQQSAVLVQRVEHRVQGLAQTFNVGVAKQDTSGARVQVASGHPIDGAFQGVQGLQREGEDCGVNEQAATEANHEHDRNGSPVNIAANAGDICQREPRAESDADEDDDAVGYQDFQKEG